MFLIQHHERLGSTNDEARQLAGGAPTEGMALSEDLAQETFVLAWNAIGRFEAHRSFRAAATELGISPSALSHAIAGLEKRLGVRLINRTTRSVSLSEAGERFLARVSPALAEIAGALEAIRRRERFASI